jgi:hypothetical protein
LTPLKHNPVAFAEKLLTNPDGSPFIPHTTQAEVLQGVQRHTTLVTGRQWGKSVGLAAYATYFGTTHANRQVYIFGPTLDQAKIIMGEVMRFFRKPSPLAVLVDGKIKEFPFPTFKLHNGTEFHARGANSPQYIRGHRAHLGIVDEAAFVKNGVIGDAIEPMFTVTGQEDGSALILTSTPFGQGEFYDAIESCKAGQGAYFHFTSFDNPFADKAFLERQKLRYGEYSLRWRTEYLGEFPDNDLAVFPWQDIEWAYTHYPHTDKETGQHDFPVAPQRGHKYVQGVDLANRSDFFVSTILDVSNPLLAALVHMDRHQQKGYTFYKQAIRANHRAYHGCPTLLDSTTLAESVVEDLADIGAEGYAFTGSRAKYEVVQELARMLAEHRLALPFNRDVVDELHYFEYDITPSKAVRMEAKRGHDDIVMSLALGAHQALLPHEVGLFLPVDLGKPPKPVQHAATKGRPYYDPIAELFSFDED